MNYSDSWFQPGGGRDGDVKLFLRRWMPSSLNGQPKAIVLIVHGMSEHSGRYDRFARALVGGGYGVWAADARGHGKTADLSMNGAGSGGLLGHCADRNALELVLADINGLRLALDAAHPGVPVFLLGHSWGSFLCMAYIETYEPSAPLAGCLLLGTRGQVGPGITTAKWFLRLFALLRGNRCRSKFLSLLSTGSYNLPFRPNRTVFDWGSRDEAAVDAYLDDPLRVTLPSAGFFLDLTLTIKRIYTAKALQKIRRTLPVYVASGSADPVGSMGTGPTRLVNRFKALGVEDVEFVLYPGARHELLNETNYEEVTANLRMWLDKHLEPAKTSALPAVL